MLFVTTAYTRYVQKFTTTLIRDARGKGIPLDSHRNKINVKES